MSLTPGKRLQMARELMGISRSEFADLLGLRYLRLVTIENDRGRMSVDDLESVVNCFPELIWWITTGKPLEPTELYSSKNASIRVLADNLETHGLPEV